MLSTHFIYGYIRVKDHSDSESETCCRHMGYSFWLRARVLYMYHPTDRITFTTVFVTPVVEHWLEREIAQWVHHEGSTRRPITSWANVHAADRNDLRQVWKYWRSSPGTVWFAPETDTGTSSPCPSGRTHTCAAVIQGRRHPAGQSACPPCGLSENGNRKITGSQAD